MHVFASTLPMTSRAPVIWPSSHPSTDNTVTKVSNCLWVTNAYGHILITPYPTWVFHIRCQYWPFFPSQTYLFMVFSDTVFCFPFTLPGGCFCVFLAVRPLLPLGGLPPCPISSLLLHYTPLLSSLFYCPGMSHHLKTGNSWIYLSFGSFPWAPDSHTPSYKCSELHMTRRELGVLFATWFVLYLSE